MGLITPSEDFILEAVALIAWHSLGKVPALPDSRPHCPHTALLVTIKGPCISTGPKQSRREKQQCFFSADPENCGGLGARGGIHWFRAVKTPAGLLLCSHNVNLSVWNKLFMRGDPLLSGAMLAHSNYKPGQRALLPQQVWEDGTSLLSPQVLTAGSFWPAPSGAASPSPCAGVCPEPILMLNLS